MNEMSSQPSRFEQTEQSLRAVCRKHPGFPHPAAVIVRQIKLLHKLSSDRGNELLRSHELSYAEYNVLMMIDSSADGSLNPSLIADAAGEKVANVTRLTTQLLDKGLITRQASASDRRMSLLRLTPEGADLIAAFMPDVTRQLQQYTRYLDHDQQAQLQALLTELLKGVERPL